MIKKSDFDFLIIKYFWLHFWSQKYLFQIIILLK